MRQEFVRDRIKADIEKLEREKDQLVHSLMRVKRDEQFEVERIRRDYKKQIDNMESRQQEILREVSEKNKELAVVEQRLRSEQLEQAQSAAQSEKERRLKPHL